MLDHSLQDQIAGLVRSFAIGGAAQIATLAGQASTRRYHRVQIAGHPGSCVVMELPVDDRPTHEVQLPFLNVHRYLSRAAFPVPRVYRTQMDDGLIALEDLGDETLEKAVARCRDRGQVHTLYRKAIDLIVKLQQTGRNDPDPECLAFGRRFDFKLLRWELDHFREWLLEADRQVRLSEADRRIVDEGFDRLARALENCAPVLVHRDFQSRNLMVVPGTSESEMRVIDFQDALLGPPVYDLVALLRDSYLELDDQMVDELIGQFCETTNSNIEYIDKLFKMQTVQRKLKDAGRFVFIDRVRKNPGFLPAIPLSLRYARDALRGLPDFAALHEVLARHVPELR